MKIVLATLFSQVCLSRPDGAQSRASRYGMVLGPDDGTQVVVQSPKPQVEVARTLARCVRQAQRGCFHLVLVAESIVRYPDRKGGGFDASTTTLSHCVRCFGRSDRPLELGPRRRRVLSAAESDQSWSNWSWRIPPLG